MVNQTSLFQESLFLIASKNAECLLIVQKGYISILIILICNTIKHKM